MVWSCFASHQLLQHLLFAVALVSFALVAVVAVDVGGDLAFLYDHHHPPDTADMDSEPKYVLVPHNKTKVDIVDTFFKLLDQHDVEGTLDSGVSVQGTIAAMSVYRPHHGVNLMDLKSGKVFFKFKVSNGEYARVKLSKDTLTLGVGSNTGVCV